MSGRAKVLGKITAMFVVLAIGSTAAAGTASAETSRCAQVHICVID